MTTLFQEFCGRWEKGCGSGLCESARNICIARGQVPCDVLFVGEAPGESEDVIGRPFVGPAGKLLDYIIERSLLKGTRYALTNLTMCIPREGDGQKAAQPLPEEIEACAPRLREFIRICQPKLIVCVGALARDYLDEKMKGSIWGNRVSLRRSLNNTSELGSEILRIDITHPAAILRTNVANQGLAVQRCIVSIRTAVEELG